MKSKDKELSFEENILKLEAIVKELESGETPLEEAIEKFKEASLIAKACDDKLKNATDSINKILKEDGTLEEFKVEE